LKEKYRDRTKTLRDRITLTANCKGRKSWKKRQKTAECVMTGCSQPSLPPVLGQKIAWLTHSVQSISCEALGTLELYFLRGGAGWGWVVRAEEEGTSSPGSE
jgi:hypothetical protein